MPIWPENNELVTVCSECGGLVTIFHATQVGDRIVCNRVNCYHSAMEHLQKLAENKAKLAKQQLDKEIPAKPIYKAKGVPDEVCLSSKKGGRNWQKRHAQARKELARDGCNQ